MSNPEFGSKPEEEKKPEEANLELQEMDQEGEEKEKGYSKEFFDMQIKFAKRLSEVSGKPFADALLYDTSLFRRFGLGRHLDRNNPVWNHFILWQEGDDLTERAYRFYKEGKGKEEKQIEQEYVQFGCFSYDYNFFKKTVSIHFTNNETSGVSPLSDERIEQRKQELKDMFEYIKAHHRDVRFVKGGSWLYSLERYKRLFPSEYTAHLERLDDAYDGMGTWGQFFDRNRKLRPEMVDLFLKKIQEAKDQREVEEAFPYQAMKAGCEIGHFYNFYSI